MDFDSLPDESTKIEQPIAEQSSPHIPQTSPQVLPDFDSIEDDSEKYSTTGQQIKAGLEGLGQGFAGPVATGVERMLGVKPEDIRGREEANPIISGTGKALGLGAGLFTGTGEAALMTKAGQVAASAAGLGELAQGAKLVHRIGSEAVKQAAEMAVLQSGDEVSKMILQDPSASAESAISNVGLSAALGGVGGAAMAGVISPLWKATAGPKVDQFLSGLKGHVDGDYRLALPEVVEKSFADLGIQPSPVMTAALSGNPKALDIAQNLYRAQNKEFMAHLRAVPEELKAKVTQSLGIPLEEAAIFSNAESGKEVRNLAIKEIKDRYQPIAEALEVRNANAAKIAIPDESRRDFGNQLMENGLMKIGTDSPYFKEYEHYAGRTLAKDSIKGIDDLTTEIRGELDKAYRTADTNRAQALQDIRNQLSNFKESQILEHHVNLAKEGIDSGLIEHVFEAAKKDAAETLNARAEVNRSYAEYAKTLDDLSDHLGLGDFKGTGNFTRKLEALSPEQIIKKFAVKGDVESIPFLRENFPDVAEAVRQHEAKDFLSKSVHDNLGQSTLDVKSLDKRVQSLMKGQPEYAEHLLGQNAIDKIQSAKVINDAISRVTNIKDTGTPAGMAKIFDHLGAGALGSVGWLMGHNPISSAMLGEMAQRMGKDLPEAIKLGMLKYMASDAPIKAEGFKAMVDFMHNTYKGENLLSKTTKSLFEGGVKTLTSNIPDEKSRAKIDKAVEKFEQNPEAMLHNEQHLGHYLPDHQIAMSESSTRALQYLQSIKPRPYRSSPLDQEIEPSAMEKARYNRALDIAQQPMVVIEHIKNGTLQGNDIQDLTAMYPALYKQMANKISNEVISMHNHPIPYRTRIGISLFLGQPLDTSMKPSSIMATQPIPKQNPQPKSKSNAFEKSNKMYLTQTQSASIDKSIK